MHCKSQQPERLQLQKCAGPDAASVRCTKTEGHYLQAAMHGRDRLAHLASIALSSLCNNVDRGSCCIAHDLHELALCRSVSEARMGVIEYKV